MAAEEECFFTGKITSCPGTKEKLSRCSRIQKIIEASELRDHFHIHDLLEAGFTSGTVTHVYCHKNCVSTYVSPHNLAHLSQKRKPHSSSKPQPKRLRSETKGKKFEFKKHCLFCIDITECKLDSEYDAKTPAQYRVPASMVATTDMCDGQVYSDTLIKKCIERNDDLGRAVHDRLLAAAGDIVAAEARYHRKCSCLFHKPPLSKDDYSDSVVDTALLQTFEVLQQDRTKVWNTVEIMDVYQQKGGTHFSRRTLLEKVESQFVDDILSFHSPGIATLVLFKNSVANTMKIVNAEDDDEEATLKKLGKEIAQELKAVKREFTSYDVHIDKPSATECTSNLLNKLLSKVHPKFTSDSSPSLPSIMVGNIVTSVTANQPTPLQIALGVLMSEHKSVINMLYKFRITCSYDEVRRFLRSAAVQGARDTALAGLTDASVGGLVQVIIDNFDAVIHSQNCRLDCHNLAMIVTQPRSTPVTHDVTIPRLSKEKMKEPIDLDQTVVRYRGPKKPDMPLQFSINLKPSDELEQAIESTWMKRGKGPSGVIGNTQNPQTVATWSYSQHAVVTLMGDLQMMTDEDTMSKMKHKEEIRGRINSDTQDRESLQHTLSECIDPMDPDSHPDGTLINIVTGAIAPVNVNIDNAVSQGQEQLVTFESSWPEGFYSTIKKQAVTFSDKRNGIKVGDISVIDQEAIYARVIGLMLSKRELDLNDVLGFELAAYPASMFHPDGSMRIATGKACLKNTLAVETSVRVWGQPSVIVVDVSAVLWTITWPTQGTIHTFVNEFKIWVAKKLNSADVHLVLDRYYDYSTKSITRVARAGKTAPTRVHKLSAKTSLPTRNAVLKCVANKVQLNRLIFELIMNDQEFLDNVTSDYRLFMTGVEPVTTVVHRGRKRAELQLYSTHEEADIRLVMHALWSYETEEARVCVISDDTDVFALLCYHYHKSGSSAPLMMKPSVHGRVCVDIPATVKKHPTLIPQVLAIHAISGCDTVAATYGIGKSTAVATSNKGFVLDSLGVIDAPWDDVEKEATKFMVAAYGGLGATMSECRQRLWAQRTAKSYGAPKLCSLPPTTEVFMQNTKRAHFQVAQWYAALDSDPAPLDPRDYGWEADDINKSLSATTVAEGVSLAPYYVLKLIRCGWASESSCKGGTVGAQVAKFHVRYFVPVGLGLHV